MESDGPTAPLLTRLLREWSAGDASALERLTPIVYEELYRLACLRMRTERPGHIMQPSALVNEAFVRLMTGTPGDWRDRTHFFAFSSRLMRQILVDFARRQNTVRRGEGTPHLNLAEVIVPGTQQRMHDLVDVDVALDELARLNERQARVVELRYFGGLENAEVADVLGVSPDTVIRDWRLARAWLFDRLQGGSGDWGTQNKTHSV